MILLIRHARAGERDNWSGDDRRRPLDERGRRQASDLVGALAGHRLTRILSSPYDRCVQTVEPLAQARGLEVEIRDELGEEQQLEEGVELVRSLLDQYVAAFRHVESGARDKGVTTLKDLSANVTRRVTATDPAPITTLIDAQLARLI